MEQRLRENQTLLQLITDAMPVLLSYVDAEHVYRYVNQTYTDWFGWSSEKIVGRHVRDVLGDAVYEKTLPAIRRVLSGEKFSFEQLMPYQTGGTRFVEVNYVPDIAESGRVRGFYALVQDISERKKAEEDQKFLLKIAEAIRRAESAGELISAVTEEVGRHLGVSRSLFMEIDLEGDRALIHPDYLVAENLASFAGEMPLSRFSPASIDILRCGQTLVNDDTKTHPRTSPYYESGYKPLGMRAFVGVPLMREGRCTAALAVMESEARAWTEKEIHLLETVAERTWLTVEKLRINNALRESEERFRYVADAVPQIVWVAGADGRTEYLNRQWSEFSGLTVEAARDFERLGEVFHPDDRETVFGEWTRAFAAGEFFEIEARMRHHATGEYRWFLIRSVPVRNEDGAVARWFGTSTDITLNKKAESRMSLLAEISESTRQFDDTGELLFAVSKAIGKHLEVRRCLFNEIDLENDLETVHRDYCRSVASVAGRHRISDYSPVTSAEMIAGKTVVNHDSRLDPRTAENYLTTYEPNGERAYIAVPLMRDGRWVASLWVSDDRPRRWSAAEISLLETIAERTWSVIEKLRIDAALRESERRFATAFNSSPLTVTITSLRTGKLVEVNETFVEMTGIRREEAVGKTTAELGLWSNPADRDEEMQAILRDGRVRNVEYAFSVRAGTELVGLVSAELLEIGGEPCALTVVQDITERKKAERERERLLEREQDLRRQADHANRLKDEFLATVSHELRTPLNAILGWATMVRQSGYDQTVMTRAFEVIERNARNQNQIISDILDVSRIITGKLNLNLEAVELSAIIDAAVDTMRPAIEAKRIRLSKRVDPSAGAISGDPDRLQQVVWNLLSNAVKFTPEGGEVEISLRRRSERAEIVVTDTGAGIEPEFLPFVFDRFRQADGKTDRRHGGLGLGLSIVRHLVEMHGGAVSVESAGAGRGATFAVSLPLRIAAGASVSDSNENAAAPGAADARRLAGLKILVVDDEADALDLAAFILGGQGATVLAAGSVDTALEIFDRAAPDLIVSDIGMPEKDGYALIREIKNRADSGGLPTPAIALTAYAGAEDNRRILQAGYQVYLPKPVEPNALIEKIVELSGGPRGENGADAESRV